MNAKALLQGGLIISVSSMFPAGAGAQAVDDTGSKWRLEQTMRAEAKQFRISGASAANILTNYTSNEAQDKAFLDQKKTVPARKEWNREIVSPNGGIIRFRVTSQGPFSALLITGKAYKSFFQDKNPKGVTKADVLVNVNCKGPAFEKSVKIPPGSSVHHREPNRQRGPNPLGVLPGGRVFDGRQGAAIDLGARCRLGE
jgi:hypothetical protein